MSPERSTCSPLHISREPSNLNKAVRFGGDEQKAPHKAGFTSLSFAEEPDDTGKVSDSLFYPTVLILVQRPLEGGVSCHAQIEHLASTGRRDLLRSNEHGVPTFR
jgi:hypothetical protein